MGRGGTGGSPPGPADRGMRSTFACVGAGTDLVVRNLARLLVAGTATLGGRVAPCVAPGGPSPAVLAGAAFLLDSLPIRAVELAAGRLPSVDRGSCGSPAEDDRAVVPPLVRLQPTAGLAVLGRAAHLAGIGGRAAHRSRPVVGGRGSNHRFSAGSQRAAERLRLVLLGVRDVEVLTLPTRRRRGVLSTIGDPPIARGGRSSTIVAAGTDRNQDSNRRAVTGLPCSDLPYFFQCRR